jgi:hypothetical protein
MNSTEIIKRMIASAFIGLAIAFLFNLLFLDLAERPLLDRIILIGLSTAAFGFLAFSRFGSREDLKHEGGKEGQSSASFSFASVVSFVRENLPGLALALVFILVYAHMGSFYNNPRVNTVDNYLDADNNSWVQRIAGARGCSLEMRAPHPFAYFIFRPLGWLSNLFFAEPYPSAIFLNSFAGGLCVFLGWMFTKSQSQNRVYAFLIAALLGLSTSHFVFGAVVESYIFSAAALIGFYLLLPARKEGMGSLVAVSLLSFGITITNFVQNFIGFFVWRPRWRDIFRFAGLTVSVGVVLTLIHLAWYPSSRPFFLLSSAQGEDEFTLSLLHDPRWRALGRVILLTRTILLYSVIAPRPFVLLEEVGGGFPRFNFFKVTPGVFHYSAYDGLGNILILIWAAILLAAGFSFLWKLIRRRKADLSLAFVLCVLFNFLLHLTYGYEPFLYSPDWTYALVFFVAIGLAPFAKNRWFQIALFVFLLLLAYNQWQFFKFVMDAVAAN